MKTLGMTHRYNHEGEHLPKFRDMIDVYASTILYFISKTQLITLNNSSWVRLTLEMS